MRQFISLLERADDDLEKVRLAQRAAGTFRYWLVANNEDTPFNECPDVFKVATKELYLLKATKVGLDDPYLYLGIGLKATKEDPIAYVNYLTKGRHRSLPIEQRLLNTPVFLVMNIRSDPGEAMGLAASINWEQFVHEYIHVLDYRRGLLRHKENQEKLSQAEKKKLAAFQQKDENYYNEASEFNAYFQQGLHNIVNYLAITAQRVKKEPERETEFKSTVLSSYATFKDMFEHWFEGHWLANMNATTARKFERRFYKLYALVRATWPDMAAIREINAEKARERRLSAPHRQVSAPA